MMMSYCLVHLFLVSMQERLVFAQFAIPLTVDLSLLPAYLLPVSGGGGGGGGMGVGEEGVVHCLLPVSLEMSAIGFRSNRKFMVSQLSSITS